MPPSVSRRPQESRVIRGECVVRSIPLTARVLVVFGAPASPGALLGAAPSPRLCGGFGWFGGLGLCACGGLFGRFARRMFLRRAARTQLCGLFSLGWTTLRAGPCLCPAARLYLSGVVFAGVGIGLALRHRRPLGGGGRLFSGGVVALSRCAPRPQAALFLLGEGDVRYRGVQLLDPEPRHVLDAVGDPAPHLLDGLEDVLVVLDPHLEVYSRLCSADLDGDPAGLALRTRQAPQHPAGGSRGASAHVDAIYLLRRHACYRGDHRVADNRGSALAQERALAAVLP